MKTNQNVDMVCTAIAMQDAKAQQDIANKLAEAATAEMNSLATFSDADAQNLVENIVSLSETISNKLTQSCMPSLVAKQSLNCEASDVRARDLSYEAAQSAMANCVLDDAADRAGDPGPVE